MDQNFLFRWIWRLNALALLVLATFGLINVVPSQLSTLGLLPREAAETPGFSIVAPKAPAPSTEPAPYEFFLDYARPGRSEIVLVLAQRLRFAGYSKTKSDATDAMPGFSAMSADQTTVANYFFIHRVTGKTRSLFPTNGQTITSTQYVGGTDAWSSGPLGTPVLFGPAVGPPAAIVLYTVAPGAKGSSAPYQLYVAKPDGTSLTKLLDDLDDEATANVQDDTLIVRYATKGRQMVATFSLADFKPIMTKDVTDLAGK